MSTGIPSRGCAMLPLTTPPTPLHDARHGGYSIYPHTATCLPCPPLKGLVRLGRSALSPKGRGMFSLRHALAPSGYTP
jgi:hypothetical protein